MTDKPARITVPSAPTRLNPGNNMAAIGDTFFGYFQPFANYMGDVVDFTDERADAALAAALGGDLPPLTGKAGQLLGVNAAEDAGQFFHPAAILGAPVTKTANFTLGANENVIICNGSAQITATLTTAVVGRIVRIENNAAFAVVSASSNVAPLGSATAGTAILPAVAGAWADLQWNGTQWNVIAGVTGATGAALAQAATPAAAALALPKGVPIRDPVFATPLTAYTTTTAQIPADDTIPQITEGAQFLTANITTVNASSFLEIEVDVPIVSCSANGTVSFAVFLGSGPNASASSMVSISAGGAVTQSRIKCLVASGAVGAKTVSVRFGPTGAATAYLNGFTNRLLGGSAAATMKITEVM